MNIGQVKLEQRDVVGRADLVELPVVLSPHLLEPGHLFSHDILLDVFSVLLTNDRRRAYRRKVIRNFAHRTRVGNLCENYCYKLYARS